ncbi:MAG: SPOR domain-containing protein [Steroidobacteraceae bacterium]
MRTLIIPLVFLNLAFAAWALLIDRPVYPPAAHDISHLPRLLLASEPMTAVTSATTGAPALGAGSPAATGHCVTVGPFSDINASAAASELLKTRGFTPMQRDEPGEDLVDYWVYLDLPSDAEATRMLQKLRAGGVADARIMPATATIESRRVSVGLFTEREGAERRSRQVKALGQTPLISEAHQSQATYWVDINLTSPGQIVSTEGLLPSAAAGAHLEIRDCPAPASSSPASAGGPAASSAPKKGGGGTP